jgi:opacity protein-like surface antigen
MTLRRAAVFASLAMATPAAAADMAPLTYPASQALTAVEVGTSWYVRGDIGAAFTTAPTITLPYLSTAALNTTTVGFSNGAAAGFAGDLGFGYRANDYVRFDATWTYWQAPGRTRALTASCPYAFTPYGTGYLWNDADTCAGSLDLRQHNNTFLANAYADLGTCGGFTPYVGGGAGVNMNTIQGSSPFYETNNGLAPYSVVYNGGAPNVWVNAAGQPLASQPAVLFATQSWNRAINQSNWRIAWALMAGFGFQLTPSVTLDVGYRYLNGGTTTLVANPYNGLSVKQTASAQMVMVGIRFVPQ